MSHIGREAQKYYFLAIWCVSEKAMVRGQLTQCGAVWPLSKI